LKSNRGRTTGGRIILENEAFTLRWGLGSRKKIRFDRASPLPVVVGEEGHWLHFTIRGDIFGTFIMISRMKEEKTIK